jgi:hypothetical protein
MLGLKEVLVAARTSRDSGVDKNHHISTLGLILMAGFMLHRSFALEKSIIHSASLGQLLSSRL